MIFKLCLLFLLTVTFVQSVPVSPIVNEEDVQKITENVVHLVGVLNKANDNVLKLPVTVLKAVNERLNTMEAKRSDIITKVLERATRTVGVLGSKSDGTVYDDIFNIPITILKAVNALMNNISPTARYQKRTEFNP